MSFFKSFLVLYILAFLTHLDNAQAQIGEQHMCGSDNFDYFSLEYSDNRKGCIKLPKVVFTFTAKNGRELTEFNYDPTSVIKIYFDSDIVYLDDSGHWRDIVKEDILEMVQIVRYPGWPQPKPNEIIDLVQDGDYINLDLVSVSRQDGKTIITIDSPYDPRPPKYRTIADLPFKDMAIYNIVVKNFASKSDISKIVDSNSLSAYLENTQVRYYNSILNLYDSFSQSCELQSERPDAIPPNDHYQRVFSTLRPSQRIQYRLPEMISEQIMRWEIDPDTTHVIEVAFIVADSLVEEATLDWKDHLQNNILKQVNQMFQNSDINVEFKASFISPVSQLNQFFHCEFPGTLPLFEETEKLDQPLLIPTIRELMPAIRKIQPTDIFIWIYEDSSIADPYGTNVVGFGINPDIRIDTDLFKGSRTGGYAYVGVTDKLFKTNTYSPNARHEILERARGITGIKELLQIREELLNQPNNNDIYSYKTSFVMAHEIGHVLGLSHIVEAVFGNTTRDYSGYRRHGFGTNFGFGYDSGNYYTIMGASPIIDFEQKSIPLFSTDKVISASELCGDTKRADVALGIGYCSTNPHPDTPIKLGGYYKGIYVNASLSLQPMIKAVSEFSDIGVLPDDLFTVDNSILKTKREQ